MFKRIKRWYEGETKMEEFDDSDSSIVVFPLIYTEYHWTAKVVRVIVGFYMKHWQWVWSTAIGVAALIATILTIK